MADVRNFVIPESDLSGLNRVTNTYEIKNVREAEVQRQQSAKKSASAAFLTNYLNPNDNLTGTPYDPQIVKGFDELLQQGTKLASEGADTNMMMMALSPGVAKLNQYSATAKLIDKRIKDQLAQVPANAGYNRLKLEEFAKKGAFYDSEGKLKDIKSIDPSVDYLTEAIKLHPAEVTTDAAIDEFVKTSPKFTNTQSVKRINSRGGYEMKKAEVTAPSWATVDEEGSIVPRYNIALEGGKPHSFNFQTGEGTTKEAEIRLMDEKDFDSLMGSNPGIADWVRGQVMRAGQGADLNSPQAKNAARAIMYDELKRRGGGGIKDIEETKEAPAPKISIRNYSGGGTKPSEQINLTEQPDVGGGYKDITSMTGGIKTSVLPDGKSFNAELVYYNPSTKKVKYIEYVSKDDKGKYGEPKWKEVSLTKFKQDVKTSNPQIDMKFLDGLENPITGTKQDTPKPSTSKMVTMVLPDGRKGQIPEDKVDQFLKDNPKAKRQ